MKLLILCNAPESRDEHGLRAAFEEQFRAHRQAVAWLESGQTLAAEFIEADEPALIVDCLGEGGNPCEPRLTNDVLAQLIACCNEREWIWLLLSDSRIFPSTSKKRFVETDTPAPATPAGQQLLARENFIADTIERHLILRLGSIIASQGDNLLMRLLARMRIGGVVTMPDAPRFCPTPAADIARVINAIHDQLDCAASAWGAYHYESADPTSAYEFAEVVLAAATQYWSMDEGAVQLRSAAADSTADVYPLLNCQRIRDTFGIQQLPWRRAIPSLLKQMHALNSSEVKS